MTKSFEESVREAAEEYSKHFWGFTIESGDIRAAHTAGANFARKLLEAKIAELESAFEHSTNEWRKMFDDERAKKLVFQDELHDLREKSEGLLRALEKFVVKVEHPFCGCNSCEGLKAIAKFKEESK